MKTLGPAKWFPLLAALALMETVSLQASTLAYWRMEGDGVNTPVAGTTQVLDTNGRTTTNTSPGIVIMDVSGNGNTVWAWDHPGAGHTYQSSVPAATVPLTGAPNRFSIQNAGAYPACLTWSKYSHPTVDIETNRPLAWTIEASIRPTATNGYRTFIGRDGNGVDSGNANRAPLYFQTTSGGYLRISFTDVGGRTYSVADSTALTVNTWYNVAAVSDGTTLKLYKDSGAGYVLVGSTTLTAGDKRLAYDTAGSTTAGDTQWGWTLGRGRYGTSDLQVDNHTDRWFGNIDEVRISDAALTPSQRLFATTNVNIIQQPLPTSQIVGAGTPATMSVIVGGLNASIQWRHESTNIVGATNSAYTITTTTTNDSGNYYVVVTNSFSSVTSAPVTLTVVTSGSGIPPGWGDADIGSPASAGSAIYANGVWMVAGGGADIGGTSDQFNFLTNSLTGDGAVIARVLLQTGSDPWAQSGVMIRNDTSAASAEVSLSVTPGNGVSFRYRYTAGGSTLQVNQTGVSAPVWLRLSRSTNTVTAAYSSNGINWTQLGTPQTVSMNNTVSAGLAVTARDNSLINAARFSSVLIVPGPQAGVPANLINPMIGGTAFAGETTWPLPQLNVASNALTPPMGWNAYFVVGVNNPGPNESAVKTSTDAIATNGLAAAGYKYVVIDDSWIGTGYGSRDSVTGDLIPDATAWPSGMKALTDYVHSKGLLFGGYLDIGASGYGNPAQIGSFGNYQHDADQIAGWGWDIIRLDDHGPGDYYAAAHAMTHNSLGRTMEVTLVTPQVDGLQFATRLGNSYRVNNDISFSAGVVTWSAILTEFDAAQAKWFAQAPGHWNDPDFLCTGLTGISDLEGRTHFNLWCILGAPLMISTDVRTSGTKYYAPFLTAATLTTLTNAEVIAVDQDALGAVGRPVAGSTAIYAKPLGSFTSGQYAVLLLNRSSSPANLTVNWTDLGLVAGTLASVRDLWAHADLGTFAAGFTSTNIPAHGSTMLKVTGSFDWSRPRIYEAESAYNSVSGTAYFKSSRNFNTNFSSGAYVTGVGFGVANAFQFNKVSAPANGLYQVDIYYACGTARTAQLSVNGGAASTLSFPATAGDTNQPGVHASYVQLNAGENTLVFSNATAVAPNFDKIVVSQGSPTGLTATAGDGAITLNWDPAATASYYQVKRATTSGGDYTVIATNVTSLSFTNTGLTNGILYYYVVSAVNPAGEGANSSEAGARPVSTTPPPVSFTVTGNQLQFAWPQDHTGWLLQAQTNTTGEGLGTTWTTLTDSDSTNQFTIPVDVVNGSVFFRLISP